MGTVKLESVAAAAAIAAVEPARKSRRLDDSAEPVEESE
jgi:hypothetical protein